MQQAVCTYNAFMYETFFHIEFVLADVWNKLERHTLMCRKYVKMRRKKRRTQIAHKAHTPFINFFLSNKQRVSLSYQKIGKWFRIFGQ